MNINKDLLNCREKFTNHEITTIIETKDVQRFIFRRPETGCYGFALTCADNLIVMNGDCYSLLVEPGYGRSGLAFLLSNVCRDPWYYFLSKVPCSFKDGCKEFSPKKADENMKYYIAEGYIKESDLDDWDGRGETGKFGEFKYYEFCHEKDIDEPMSPFVIDSQTILQIAGLQVFSEKFKATQGAQETERGDDG